MFLILIIVLIIILGYPLCRFIYQHGRLLIIGSNSSYKIYSFLEGIMDRTKSNIEVVSYLFFSLLFIGITYLQIKINSPIYDLRSKSLVEILGFSLAILSLYGIYIGFLQYLTDHNEGNLFLGKSKVNYLINKSIWYRMTQSRFFFATLMLAVFIPVFIKLNIPFPPLSLKQTTLQLSYVWQTTIITLLLMYILLLRMSLEIISITLLMKTGSDSGMQYIIKQEIQDAYERAFWKSYNMQSNYSDLIERMLSRDLKKLKPKDIDEYIVTSFEGINQEFLFQSKEKFWKKDNQEGFARFYISHLQKKWRFLATQIKNISYPVWQKLIVDDISHVSFFEQKLKKSLVIPGRVSLLEKSVSEFLFDQLLEKSDENLNEIITDTEKSTKELNLLNLDTQNKADMYKVELEKYKWKKIFSIYNHENTDVKLPNLKTKLRKENSKSGSIVVTAMDFSNSNIYSQACFDFLIGHYGKITADIQSNQSIKSLIRSMNNEYLVAFILHQMFYTDGSSWEKNFAFFDSTLKKILTPYQEEEYKYYFNFAKNVLLNTNISHRITENFLDCLWDTRNKSITGLESWYSKFNQTHISTPFRLLYIQSLFSSHFKYQYTSRIQPAQADHDLAIWICTEFLQLLAENPALKENESLNMIVQELFMLPKFDFTKLLKSLELKSILYFEYMLKYDSKYSNRLPYQKILLNSIEMNDGNIKRYYFTSTALMHFFVLKSIKQSYQSHFNEVELYRTLKYKISEFLASNDLDLHEYVVQLYQELKEDESIRISKIEKDMIIDKLQSVIYN